MVGVDFADSALGALDGADACVLVTEWPEFAELDWARGAAAMARPARDRRAQLPRPARRCAPPGSPTRASGRRSERCACRR